MPIPMRFSQVVLARYPGYISLTTVPECFLTEYMLSRPSLPCRSEVGKHFVLTPSLLVD
jgi:hypothetical protein